jgi:hypothetical protein
MTKRTLAIVLVAMGLVLVSLGGVKYWLDQRPTAGLKVETDPESIIFVDNKQVGQSPLDMMFRPGEVSVRIVPSSGDTSQVYQTKVNLYTKTYTVIKRQFGHTLSDTAGETVSLASQPSQYASLTVTTSDPVSALVVLDGQPKGFTPLVVSPILVGDHKLTISAAGYTERVITAHTVAGYNLTVNAKLASVDLGLDDIKLEPTPTPTTISAESTPAAKLTPTKPTIKPSLVPRVEIKTTPTGFLRVREKPTTSAKEIAKVNPGDIFNLSETLPGWYKIEGEFGDQTTGWISAQYAKKL